MATETLNREELINEIWNKRGKIGLVANAMGVHVKTIYNYAGRYATVQSALDAARLQFDEVLVDTAEMGLQKAVIGVEAWAIKYTLSTKGKSRGYIERQEQIIYDLSSATDEQLQRIADGEHPASAMANTSKS